MTRLKKRNFTSFDVCVRVVAALSFAIFLFAVVVLQPRIDRADNDNAMLQADIKTMENQNAELRNEIQSKSDADTLANK